MRAKSHSFPVKTKLLESVVNYSSAGLSAACLQAHWCLCFGFSFWFLRSFPATRKNAVCLKQIKYICFWAYYRLLTLRRRWCTWRNSSFWLLSPGQCQENRPEHFACAAAISLQLDESQEMDGDGRSKQDDLHITQKNSYKVSKSLGDAKSNLVKTN